MKYGLSDKQLQEIKEILASYESVDKAVLFGSRAIDTYKEASDVDIAIKGEQADWSLAITIKEHLEEETYLPFFFDVVAYGSVESEELKEHIDGKGKVLFERGMSKWREVRLSKHIDLINGFAFKSKDFLDHQEQETLPVIKIKNVANGDVNLEKVVYHKYDDSFSRYLLSKGDVLIAMTGNHPQAQTQVVGAVSKYKLDLNALLNQRVGKIIPIGSTCLDFVYYFFKDKDTHRYLANESSGSANQANISKATIVGIETDFPEPAEQKAIAEVLSSLDDKIDLLHRQNKTLEQMAETLYESWVSDKDYDSTIKDLVNIQNGYAFKSKDFEESGSDRILKIKNISGGIVDIQTTDFVSSKTIANVDDRFFINEGDVLFAMTGAKIGKMGIIPKTESPLWLNQRVGLFIEKYKGARFFAYLHLKSDWGLDYIENTASGSAQPNISGTGIESCEFPEFGEDEIKEYSEQLDLLFDGVIFNLGKIRTLESLRDTLLPKLMSGEVRIARNG